MEGERDLAVVVGVDVHAAQLRLTRYGTAIWTGLAVVVVAASEIPVVLIDATTATHIALAAVHLAVGAVLIRARGRVSPCLT
ncbi:DUF6069 family protein [Actinomycetospora flava]|uniref:DUF6069 family protein n=1 Tax=Actinomycetospora flava TaxID=3129232 RepID=A0ABU8LZ79_9PSEU